MSESKRQKSVLTRTRVLPVLVVLVGGLLFGTTVLADRSGSSTTDLITTARTQAGTAPTGVNARFWDAMVEAGVTAGLHDGYRECLEPEAGVEVFDIEQYGELVNPAYDAGYQAAGRAIQAACSELTATAGELNGDERSAHRESLTGATFDTGDAHPDFGKGHDLGRRVLIDVDCDVDRAVESASPPEAWPVEHYSEFLDGYLGGLTTSLDTCG